MEFEQLLSIVGDEPVFETGLLLAGSINPNIVRLQLTRWTKSGRLYQLRRGLYALAPPYQKVKPHPFLIANRMVRASYVSMQSALALYGLIPEIVHSTTSITAGRPAHWSTPLGAFDFRHIQRELLCGYRMAGLGSQHALVASPEKALLDLVYLHPGGETLPYLHALRLQNLGSLNLDELNHLAAVFDLPKLHRAVESITHLVQTEAREYESL